MPMDFSGLVDQNKSTYYWVKRSNRTTNSRGVFERTTESEQTCTGVVLDITDREIQYSLGGTYTTQDKKIYTYIEHTEGERIRIGNDMYTLHAARDYSVQAGGLRKFIAKKDGGTNA